MQKKKTLFWRFLISRVFWKNLAIAIIILVVLLIGIQLSLRFYTDHGKEISVPNFSGMSLQEVDQMCYQKNLKWLIQDSTYNPDTPGGSVVDQYPPAGFKVKKNRKVFLTTNSWYPEMIMMPKASDTHFRQAKKILESAGLHIDSLEYEPYMFRTYVLKQKFRGEIIEPGTPIEKGSGITLVLGQGLSNETDQIPKLVGITRDTAMDIVLNLHFNLGAVVFDESIIDEEDSLQARIYKQFPDYHNHKAKLGSPIDIWLTMDTLKLMEADSTLFPRDSLADFGDEQLNE